MKFYVLMMDQKKISRIENRIIQNLENVIYRELPQNLGRSKIRNVLGKAAKFDYLLFLDCDSKVVSDNYHPQLY